MCQGGTCRLRGPTYWEIRGKTRKQTKMCSDPWSSCGKDACVDSAQRAQGTTAEYHPQRPQSLPCDSRGPGLTLHGGREGGPGLQLATFCGVREHWGHERTGPVHRAGTAVAEDGTVTPWEGGGRLPALSSSTGQVRACSTTKYGLSAYWLRVKLDHLQLTSEWSLESKHLKGYRILPL